MSNEVDKDVSPVSPVWLSMNQLLISNNDNNEVRSIHSHSRRKSPTLAELLNSSLLKLPKRDDYDGDDFNVKASVGGGGKPFQEQ